MSKTAMEGGTLTPEDVRDLRNLMADECEQREPFDVVAMGVEVDQRFVDAGVTWHIEPIVPFTQSLDEMKAAIEAGPRQPRQ